MFVAVYEQVARNSGIGRAQIKWQAIGFGIPIGTAAIFFARKAFGPNVEALIIAGVGLHQLKNIKADALLCGDVSFDGDVALTPGMSPYGNMFAQ